MSIIHASSRILLLITTGLITLAVLALALATMAEKADLGLKSRDEAVVRNGLISLGAELQSQVVPNAVWDEAVKNLDNSFDSAWAHDNVGIFFKATMKAAFALVIDAMDKPVYAMVDGADASLSPAGPIWHRLSELRHSIRSQEELRTRLLTNDREETLRAPIQASSFVETAGRIFFVSATLVQSDFGKMRITQDRAPIIVIGRELDTSLLQQLGNRYMLDGIAIERGRSLNHSGLAHAVIRDDLGAAIATIHWRPHLPGMALLSTTLPWAVIVMLGLFSGTVYFYARSQRAENDLLGSERRAIDLAYNDALTSLHNRAFLELTAPDLLKAARELGLKPAYHSIDLDQFKQINDLYGHSIGDEILKEAARRCRSECSPKDICVRTSGDGFGVLQFSGGGDGAEEFVKRLQARLLQPYRLSVGQKSLSTSIGSAIADDGRSDALEVFRRADVALRFAKTAGCAQIYDPATDHELQERNDLLEELRLDIASGRLEMVYQPQFDRLGTMIGVEALVRWSRAAHGAISPSVFVGVAEDAGLISQLGDLTIRKALEDSKHWPDLKTAINISASQLRSEDFATQMIGMIVSAGVDPAKFEIELTEGVLLSELEVVTANLASLRAAGLSVALDDFGTGYSSLSYLSRFPVDKLKIDRSFVLALGKSHKAKALIEAIVTLAQALEVRVIAEGVETDEQWLGLCAAGCTEFQGYLTGRPMSASQLVMSRRVAPLCLTGSAKRIAS
ncbi:MAG: bifunctional diguanylate cyclase/phosphodiesterase [Hyphomicrobiaceae bacterium]|nr:bifunctional diguanylate cyclase/phosphodiesterase [Hyphomicrobiaceae bacterium]